MDISTSVGELSEAEKIKDEVAQVNCSGKTGVNTRREKGGKGGRKTYPT